MPRLPRVYVEGAIYYITCRGNENEELFKDEKDYKMYLELLEKYKKEYGFKLFAYVLLPQHIHLLIEPSETVEISEIMRSLNTAYPKYYNNRYLRRGHLYRERFKACIAEKTSYLPKLINHIHSNPQRIKLVSEPFSYPYSSFSKYQDFPESEEAKDLMGYLPVADLRVYLNRPMQAEETSNLHKKLQRGGILGSKEFVKMVKEKASERKQAVGQLNQKASKKIGVLTWVFILTGFAALMAYLLNEPKEEPVKVSGPVEKAEDNDDQALKVREIKDLNNTEWQVRLTSSEGDESFAETLSFINGKFISAFLNKKGFFQSNYSVSKQSNTIIWETMQSHDSSTASWRGEINNNSMQGILSLSSEDKTKVFSFISINFRRK